MIDSSPRRRAERFLIYQQLAIAICCAGAIWGMYLLEHFAGRDLKGRKIEARGPMSVWIPIAATPVIGIGAYLFYIKLAALLLRGQQTTGTIGEISSFKLKEMRDVTYVFQVDGQQFTTKRSIVDVCLADLSPGDQVEVVYDPRNPEFNRLAVELWNEKVDQSS
jgi:hypothetical protein